MRVVRFTSFLVVCATLLSAQESTTSRVRQWRAEHEREILRELFDFLSIPNVATNQDDIKRNADALMRMFERRRFAPETLPTGGSPMVIAERRVPNARRTITLYFHYDGQPVNPVEWTYGRAVPACHRRVAPAGRPDDYARLVEGRDRS